MSLTPLTIAKRIQQRDEWAAAGLQMANHTTTKSHSKNYKRPTALRLTKNLHISDDVSDFMDKLKAAEDGEFKLLKTLKGTFGFPFRTRLGPVQWFSKMIVYHLDIDDDKLPEEPYEDLTPAGLAEFHRELSTLKTHSVNTEDQVQAILTNLVLNKVTPHVCLMYGATVLDAPKHKPMIQAYIDKYKRKYKEDFVDMAKVLMTEWADQGDLSEFIDDHKHEWTVETWRALLFQMLAMVALIQEKIPSFRHNDLSLSNILVQQTHVAAAATAAAPSYYKYRLHGQDYWVPDIGFRVLMADFDYASIEAMGITNEKLDTDSTRKFGTVPDPNGSFDCHMMLNWLNMWVLKLYKASVVSRGGEPIAQVKAFFDSVVEAKYQGETNRWLKHSRFRNGKKTIPELVPRHILQNNAFFAPFRSAPPPAATILEEYNIPPSA